MSNENVGSNDASKKEEGAQLPPALRLDPVVERGWHYFADEEEAYLVDGYVRIGQNLAYLIADPGENGWMKAGEWVVDYAKSGQKPYVYDSAENAELMYKQEKESENARMSAKANAQIDAAALLLKKALQTLSVLDTMRRLLQQLGLDDEYNFIRKFYLMDLKAKHNAWLAASRGGFKVNMNGHAAFVPLQAVIRVRRAGKHHLISTADGECYELTDDFDTDDLNRLVSLGR